MIDFADNGSVYKLKQVPKNSFYSYVQPLLIDDEVVISAYQTIRDGIVFTNFRILTINLQGIAGKKIDITTLPYKSIQIFSVENAGVGDSDAELDIWFSGQKRIRFEFSGKSDIGIIGKIISTFTL